MESVETPPFWQPSATATWRRRRRSAPILHSSLILILLPCLSLIFFLFIVVPSIPKFVPQNIDNKSNNTPTSFPIKKSWQSLNVVLVVFAILCGVFARRNDDVSAPENHHLNHHHRREEPIKSGDQINAGSQQWYGYSEQTISSPLTPVTGISRLRRTVSELPPSQGFQWETGNDKLRFFDDFDVSNYYPVTPSHVIHHRYHHVIPEINRTEPEIDEPKVKEIPVDNFVLETRGELPSPTISPPPTPPPRSPVPPPPRQMSNKKPKRTFQNLPRTPPPPPPPPPPQQPPSMAAPYGGWREKKRRSSRKRINATKEIANAIASLYNNKRKRKLKSRQSYENPLVVESESPATPAPPPPPPPPPPPSIFHSLFRKGSKTKKIHSLSSIPDPPTLPHRKPVNPAGKPPLPTNSGNQSPLITPPAPPLKVTEMKFVMRGSREVEEVDGREMNGEDEEREGKGEPSMTSSSSVTCPSPDVNAKADNFIARLHDGWRLEKLNSWREKHQSGPRPIV